MSSYEPNSDFQSRQSLRSQSFVQAKDLNQSLKGSLFGADTPVDLMLPKANFVEESEFKKDPICFVCKIPFNLKDRQHHCRLCANSCCSKCSTRTINKQRACDICFLRGSQVSYEKKRQKYLKSMKDNVKKIKQHIQSGNAKLEALAKEIIAIEASNAQEYKSVKEEGIQFQTQYTQIIQDKLSLQDRLIFLKEQLRQKLTERDRLIDQDQEIENIIRSRDTEIYLKESALANKEDQLQKLKQQKDDLLNDTQVPEEEIQVQKPNSSLYDLSASEFLDKNIETKQIILPQQQFEKQEKGCCVIF